MAERRGVGLPRRDACPAAASVAPALACDTKSLAVCCFCCFCRKLSARECSSPREASIASIIAAKRTARKQPVPQCSPARREKARKELGALAALNAKGPPLVN